MRTREVDPSERAAPDSIREHPAPPPPRSGLSTDPGPARPSRPGSRTLTGMRAVVVLVLALVLTSSAPATAEPVPSGEGLASWTSPLGDPPRVARPFAPPASPYGPGHRGVDLAGAPGTPVLAAGDGVVVFAGMVAGRPVVSVEHPGGLRTTYEPVDPVVAAGQAVARGSPIGAVRAGHTGCPDAACLHWGLRRGETYLDPMMLLSPPRVRLLPLG